MLRAGPDLRPGRASGHRLHQVGPQPLPDRRRALARRSTRGASSDAAGVPDDGRAARAGTRGSRSSPARAAAAASTSACSSAPTASGRPTATIPHDRVDIQRWTGLLLPPELQGTHIGAEESHTTHRVSHARLPRGDGVLGQPRRRARPHRGRRRGLRAHSRAGSPRTRSCAPCCTPATSCTPTRMRPSASRAWSPRTGDRPLYQFVVLDRPAVWPPAPLRLPGLAPDTVYEVTEFAPGDPVPGGQRPPWMSGPLRLPGRVLEAVGNRGAVARRRPLGAAAASPRSRDPGETGRDSRAVQPAEGRRDRRRLGPRGGAPLAGGRRDRPRRADGRERRPARDGRRDPRPLAEPGRGRRDGAEAVATCSSPSPSRSSGTRTTGCWPVPTSR